MAGRPQVYKSRTIYTFSVEKELLDRFREIARREGKAVSHLLQELIEDYIKRHGDGNPCFRLDKWVEEPEMVAFPTLGEEPKPELVQNLDNDTLAEYAFNASRHLEAARNEIRRRMAEGSWKKPYHW